MGKIDSSFQMPTPVNEPIRQYAPGSPERASLQASLKKMASEKIDIPLFIGGQEIRTGKTKKVVMPHDHQKVIAEFHLAGPEEIRMAIDASLKAKASWEAMRWQDRAAIFLKAADLLAGPYRDLLNGSSMLGQSKNCYQAEIDAACEYIDFLRFNNKFYQDILEQQPLSVPGLWNYSDYRPLEGFVLSITPFNFTSIAGNLGTTPALVGNTVVWKPSDTQMLSAYYTMRLLQEAGLPAGVMNMIGAEPKEFGELTLKHPELAGVHFTGSTQTFQYIYKTVGMNIENYRSYPRIVGETGGKDFVFAHESANVDQLATALVRGAFEYQGQKCSAASRAYVPKRIWPAVRDRMIEQIHSIQMGDVQDFSNFMNAVIDQRAFDKISKYIEFARSASDAEIRVGGECDSSKGYFVRPTVIETQNPHFKTMVEEIFGPVLTVFPYDESKLDETLEWVDSSTPYALTGSVVSQDRKVVEYVSSKLRHAAGNFYVNDKPTAAVVGQQPFGGGRKSGTNDKAGSIVNLYRWISIRSLKETLVPPSDYRYPFLG